MQIKVKINNINQITLPIGYHHIEQSAIYALIRGELHDRGLAYEKRDYKLFTFGPFEGKYKVMNKQITFFDSIGFEFRCFDEEVMHQFIDNIKLYGFRLGDISYHNIDLEVSDYVIENEKIHIRMLSPICVYRTKENGYTQFLSPESDLFYKYVSENFERKYYAAFGEKAKEMINIKLAEFSNKDKCFTKYKNYFIEAWGGCYILKGKREYLSFLYNTGLGAKNSQGFGMFEIL